MQRLAAASMLLVVVAACAVAPRDHPDAAEAGAPPVSKELPTPPAVSVPPEAPRGPRVIGSCDKSEKEKGAGRFVLAHFNDLQARYSDMIAGKSRYAYIAGYLKQQKAERPTLVLDAGDDYEKGAVAELRSFGETTRQMVQALPIDVRVIGNHDFAYGEFAVLRDVRMSAHPVLAANVTHVGLPASKQPFRPYARVDVGCVKVGVIGLVTQNFGADDQPTSAPYDGVFAQDEHYHAILEREAKAHRAEVDVLIALTHLGYADDLALAHRGGKLVDFIVGGHTEDLLKEPGGISHPDGSKTFVVQAGHYGEVLGRAEVLVNLKDVLSTGKHKVSIEKYKIVDVDEKMPAAADVADLARRLQEVAAPGAQSVIGRLNAPVKQGRPMAELLHRATADAWGVDVLVVGRDLFWGGLAKGDLTLQRLYDPVLVQRQPAGTSGFSSIWIAEVSGAELTALAKAFRSGTYEWLGQRTKFDPSKRYKLALDKRGATYPKQLFAAEAKLVRPALKGEMIDALEAYVRARTAKGLAVD